jgi:hypothetical protein
MLLREERGPGGPTGGEAAPRGGGAVETREERVLRCARCSHALALEKDRASPDGKHVHVFVNPSGIEYTIGCFREAAGCVGWGEPSSFWSWFPGHAWRMALCGACTAHVGWSFVAVADESQGFFGLILDRIA